ncbi:GNAT family N-acetyltransferase [Mycolicibacterium wolinskyi]|uniref:GNAT family N-acetyltransferase n=1 Tax=Mycolicibacterium wolinskyi TaxID=59750 RepID=UPI001F430F26|nr:GNAT family N-acetyltransferase [Mycolicibacterium wolinskyi]
MITIRPLTSGDSGRVVTLYQSLTDEERYLRFFTVYPAHLRRWACSLTEQSADQYAIGAFASKELLGVANYVRCSERDHAEAAVVVAHDEQFRGIGTALLNQLGKIAKRSGIRYFVAEVLTENQSMMHVISESGWPCSRRRDGSVLHIELDLDDVSE